MYNLLKRASSHLKLASQLRIRPISCRSEGSFINTNDGYPPYQNSVSCLLLSLFFIFKMYHGSISIQKSCNERHSRLHELDDTLRYRMHFIHMLVRNKIEAVCKMRYSALRCQVPRFNTIFAETMKNSKFMSVCWTQLKGISRISIIS